MLAIHADTGISFIFAMSINCSIIYSRYLIDVVLYRIGIKLIRMLRRCIIKVYVLSI